MKKGFTLIELLVVVVVVGILAAIALPQFETAIEKSRMAEALVNMGAIADAVQRFDQAFPGEKITSRANIADLALQGSGWTDATTFRTKLFDYKIETNKTYDGVNAGKVIAYRKDNGTTLYTLTLNYNKKGRTCTTSDGYDDFQNLCTFYNNL